MDWINCGEALPPPGQIVYTKIAGGHDANEQPLCRDGRPDLGNLWFVPDGSMYVYYTPTHWRPMEDAERAKMKARYIQDARDKLKQAENM